MRKILAPCHVHIKTCAAIVIRTSYKHASLVHNLSLASRRAICPSGCALEWLHIPERPLHQGLKHLPALLASFCSPSARLHPCTSKYFGSCLLYLAEAVLFFHSQPLHLSFSHPRADFVAVLGLLSRLKPFLLAK